MIIYTCPKCGHDLHDIVLASNPPISKKECWSCGWSWTGESEEVVRIPFGGNSLDITNVKLEDAINIFDVQGELEKYEKTLNFMNEIGL